KLLLAYHDRSDGGLAASLCEMAFASRCGLSIDLGEDPAASDRLLFNEELGVVFQALNGDRARLVELANEHGLQNCLREIGQPQAGENISIKHRRQTVLEASRVDLHRAWSETTWKMQSLRDHPECARQEYDRILDTRDSGLYADVSFELQAAEIGHKTAPRMAILREQGVNGQIEMASAFDRAGFDAVDVTMSDLVDG
ncbi:MAG: phosphoribosylformylglycinamidine synthase, partial [Desulfobacterales bacterium]|nr:phosphoribosylformylglycinamidine synthase [Desulfobacterales bacterium]